MRKLAAVLALWVAPSGAAIDPSSLCDVIDPNYLQWSADTASSGAASLPAHDTGFSVAGSRAYFAQGTKLLAFRNVTDAGGAAGSKAWEQCFPNCASASTIENFPTPVPVSTPALHGGNSEFLFVGASDGFLYKVRALDGVVADSADTRRYVASTLVCQVAPGDKLIATPAVVLYNFATVAFQIDVTNQGHAGDDVVIVFTANGCSDTTRNRIIAYWASDLTVKWIFNDDGAVKVDRGTEGCTIDYANMRLFCGADLADGAAGQDSLFALDIVTGQLLWSANAGAILNRPMLNFGTNRLYVASKPGSLMAYDPATGGQLWAVSESVVSAGSFIARTPSVEWRAGSWQNRILVLDSGGTLHAAKDNGSTGEVLWSRSAFGSGVKFRSLPVVLPGAVSYAFVGRNDGLLQMLQLGETDLSHRGAVTIEDTYVGDVYDPSMDLDIASGTLRIVAAGPTKIRRLTIPFCAGAPF